MKLKDNGKSYFLLFWLGILAGIITRLSDFCSFDTLWSFSSIATLYGFWIASVGVITYFSSSNKGAFINTFLYMFGMTVSFYGLKYILGFFDAKFDNNGQFQTSLFLVYSVLSVVCGVGSFILYAWNENHKVSSFLCALPASGMLAEAIGCLFVLVNKHILLAQTIFDFAFAFLFGVVLFRKANHKVIYLATLAIITGLVFFIVYQPTMLTV
jgi:hypothetical protein